MATISFALSVESDVPQAIFAKPLKVWGGNGNDWGRRLGDPQDQRVGYPQ